MKAVGHVLLWLVNLYLVVLVVRLVLSWIPLGTRDFRPGPGVRRLFEVVYALTDPPIRFLDRRLPSARLGAVRLSVGFLVVWVAVLLLQRLVGRVFGL